MAIANAHRATADFAIDAFEQFDNGVEIQWTDGFRSFFHHIWLRDCCYCEDCGDSYSSSRYFVPSDITLDIKPESVSRDDNGCLSIVWSPGDHRSSYDAAWLRQNCYDDVSLSTRFQRPVLWNGSLNGRIPCVSYDEASEDSGVRMDLYRKLRDYGFVLVRDGSGEPGSITQVANLIGELGGSSYSTVFDLTPQSKIRTLGNSTRPVPPHTDEAFRHAPPGINILSCVRPADDGGKSVLTDGFNLANILREDYPQAFAMLTEYAQSYHRIHDSEATGTVDERTRQSMFDLDDRGEVVGVRIHTRAAGPLTLPPEIVEAYYAAHHRLCRLMTSAENQVKILLQTGDTILFDNHRVLHARTDFTDPERFLQICNVPRESFHERLRLLARTLGHYDESEMILCRGA